jgi:hypothetical protein
MRAAAVGPVVALMHREALQRSTSRLDVRKFFVGVVWWGVVVCAVLCCAVLCSPVLCCVVM